MIIISNWGDKLNSKDIKKVFEPFYRLKNKNFPSGFGLGLTICKRIIKAHNGEITIESKKNQTEFHVKIPLKLEGT